MIWSFIMENGWIFFFKPFLIVKQSEEGEENWLIESVWMKGGAVFNQTQIYEEDASVKIPVGNGPCVIPWFDPS